MIGYYLDDTFTLKSFHNRFVVENNILIQRIDIDEN